MRSRCLNWRPGLPSEVLAARPDVAAAEAQLIAANANIRVARADFFPQVTLSGSAGWKSLALWHAVRAGLAVRFRRRQPPPRRSSTTA